MSKIDEINNTIKENKQLRIISAKDIISDGPIPLENYIQI